jgi:NAD(P)-dependent dehydrogenase (short-subunit alcohol dehydrogenase family)
MEKNMSQGRFEGKVAVITGGNSGIGLVTAHFFHKEGAKVAIMGRNQKSMNAALKTLGEDSFGFSGEVSSVKDLETFMEKVKAKFGKIDSLFVNAGIIGARPTPVATASEEEFDQILAGIPMAVFLRYRKLFHTCQRVQRSCFVLRSTLMSRSQVLGRMLPANPLSGL